MQVSELTLKNKISLIQSFSEVLERDFEGVSFNSSESKSGVAGTLFSMMATFNVTTMPFSMAISKIKAIGILEDDTSKDFDMLITFYDLYGQAMRHIRRTFKVNDDFEIEIDLWD